MRSVSLSFGRSVKLRYVEVSSDLAWYVMFSFVLADAVSFGTLRSVWFRFGKFWRVWYGQFCYVSFGWVKFWQVSYGTVRSVGLSFGR